MIDSNNRDMKKVIPKVNWSMQVRFLQQDSFSKPKKYKYPLVYDPYGYRSQPSSKIM